MSKKLKTVEPQDDKAVLHLNAVLCAVQYLDDLIKMSADQDISYNLIQTHELPKQISTFSLSQLQKHFKDLQIEKTDDTQLKVGQLSVYPKLINIFKRILEKKERKEWFVVRIDEKIHQAEGYYEVIPYGCCLSIIAAKLHANHLNNVDIDVRNTQNKQFLIQVDHSDKYYGGLFNEQIVIMKGESFTSAATQKDPCRMGRVCYNCLKEKPQPYQSIQEVLRDFILIGINCRYFNKTFEEFTNLAMSLLQDTLDYFKEEFSDTDFSWTSCAIASQDKIDKLVADQMKWKMKQ